MRSRVVWMANVVAVIAAILVLPASGYAQDATLSGTVTDSTGAVVPGTTVTAVNEASGNVFEAVTDEGGKYRISLRTGTYKVTAQLVGFQNVTRTGQEVLVGQQAALNFQLMPSTVQESITVTGEAPLVNISSSALEGNIDPRQVQQLPVNGRNFMDLSILAPGSRANASTDQPTPETTAGRYQINVDGQQVTNQVVGGFGQARYSRDSIGEFEFVSNRFDVTQGRSVGVQVNVVTKSGTNSYQGTFSGYFRSDSFNAPDPVAKRVLPYSDQQVSTTFGGPIKLNKVHFFANYEYERNPNTLVCDPYPAFNFDVLSRISSTWEAGGWTELSAHDASRSAIRSGCRASHAHGSRRRSHHDAVAGRGADRKSDQIYTTFSQVLSSRSLNEIRRIRQLPLVLLLEHRQPDFTCAGLHRSRRHLGCRADSWSASPSARGTPTRLRSTTSEPTRFATTSPTRSTPGAVTT